jgi:hypothetical protein
VEGFIKRREFMDKKDKTLEDESYFLNEGVINLINVKGGYYPFPVTT